MDDFVKNNYEGFLLIYKQDDDTCIGMIRECYYNKIPSVTRPDWACMDAYKGWDDDDNYRASTESMIKRVMELKK